MQKVDIVYFNAGGGHRAAALALKAAIEEQHRPWEVRLVNLFEVLDPKRWFNFMFGFNPETYYNTRVARDWTFLLDKELPVLQAMIRMADGPLTRRMATYWGETQPDIVVSVVPNFNRSMIQGLRQARPGVHYLTVMTDMADLPPHFWIEPDLNHQLICGTPHAVEQARASGIDMAGVRMSSGMILRPDFYRIEPIDRAAERGALGFDADEPIGIAMFGGLGSMQMVPIARELADRPMIHLCGHNDALARRLDALKTRAVHRTVGFTKDVPRYMQMADYFIGKPGPASLSEAVMLGLPVITYENRSTMPQERYNIEWLRENGVGVAVASARELPGAVDQVIGNLPAMKQRAAAIRNRAVFDVADRIGELLGQPDVGRGSGASAGVSAG